MSVRELRVALPHNLGRFNSPVLCQLSYSAQLLDNTFANRTVLRQVRNRSRRRIWASRLGGPSGGLGHEAPEQSVQSFRSFEGIALLLTSSRCGDPVQDGHAAARRPLWLTDCAVSIVVSIQVRLVPFRA